MLASLTKPPPLQCGEAGERDGHKGHVAAHLGRVRARVGVRVRVRVRARVGVRERGRGVRERVRRLVV